MKDKPNKLDEIIREKMTGLGSQYRPETWDWLSERLDTQDGAIDPVDDLVKQKLSGLSVPYRPETWDWMNERLDEIGEGSPAGAEMQTMDEAIYDRMHRLEKPYDPNHWPLLLKKLEGNVYVGERIVRYKAMELSLLLLLLITFIRLPISGDQTPPAQPLHQERPQAVREKASTAENQVLAEADIPGQSSPDREISSTAIGEDAAARQIRSEEQAPAVAQLFPGNDLRPVKEEEQRANQESYRQYALGEVKDLNRLPLEKRSLPIPDKKIPAEIYTNSLGTRIDGAILGVNAGNILGVMAYLPTSLAHPLCLTCTGKLDKEALEAKQPTFVRIGMQGGPDYNRVITPPTSIRGQNYRADRYSLGYSGGLTIGLEKGRWEIETGLIYSNIRYYALPVLVLDGSVEEGFFGDGTKQFDLDVFQVPLNFRYNFLRKNRWRIYAMAGMSMNVTTQSNYYLAEPEGFMTEDFRPAPARPGKDNAGRSFPSIKSEFDNFTKGWLEGGDFSKNTYLTGNVGFGIERFLTDHWSIYAQPTYSHSWIYLNNGLGPYYDRINTNSLTFGFKVRLK